MAWVALAMTWDDGQNLTDRWDHVCGAMKQVRTHWKLGTAYSGFAAALVRQSGTVCNAVKRRFQQVMQLELSSHWRREGWVVFAVDGTRFEAPHTAANEAGLRCAGREKTAPQVYLTTIYHAGTGLPWDYRLGPGTDSERLHPREMVPELPQRSLLLADAGFAGYPLCRQLLRSGHSFLIRVGGNVQLLTDLGYYECDPEGLVFLWPEQAQRDHRRPLVLRLIRLRRNNAEIYLLTNILDQGCLSDTQAQALYELRWGEEVFFRSCKQTLARRTLKSRTPETCLAEAEWTLLGVWLLGLMSTKRLIAAGTDPLELSIAKARDAVRRSLRNTKPHRHRHGTLEQSFQHARKDGYMRLGPKAARNYPRKKHEQPPRPPKIKPATTRQVTRAKQLPPPNIPQSWTA